jgi:hypothetical protein
VLAGVLAWAGNQTLAKKEAKKTNEKAALLFVCLFIFTGSFA